jgi:hypothetical protein
MRNWYLDIRMHCQHGEFMNSAPLLVNVNTNGDGRESDSARLRFFLSDCATSAFTGSYVDRECIRGLFRRKRLEIETMLAW